jgi:diguanylate cyclase (GGDEF)-like protein/PAS domain S-box-containing protein
MPRDDSPNEAFHRSLVENLAEGVYFVEPDRTIKYWNPGAERLAGFAAGDMVGHRCYDNLLAHVDGQGNSLCHTICPLAASMADGQPRETTVWLRHKEGYRKPVHVRTAAVRDASGQVIGGVESFSDATAEVVAASDLDRARREALTDELTGLPNRRMFDSALNGRLENLRRYGWAFGLLIVDVDLFKTVNDEHGHAAGDAVLAAVARTIVGAIRAGDVVARWGGEEFAVLVEASDVAGLTDTAERIRILVARSETRFDGLGLPVTVSLGGALARPDDTAESLFARTDSALYTAKNAGRDRAEIA